LSLHQIHIIRADQHPSHPIYLSGKGIINVTLQEMLILYVGTSEHGETIRAAAELDGGYVYLPEHMLQALGMYITYLPNVVVVDSAVSYSGEFIDHLRSVDARPILVLGDVSRNSRQRVDGVYVISRDSNPDEVLESARQLASGSTMLHARTFSNGYRRTG
jgi:hypothetical protein